MFDNLHLDYLRYSKKKGSLCLFLCKAATNAGFRAVMLYRIGYWFRKHKLPLCAAVVERFMHHLCHCWIGTNAEIGPGFFIAHVGGLVIGNATRIGKNFDVRQNTTFGGNFSKTDAEGHTQPMLGDNVSVGTGAVIIGPINVGTNSIIGANSVVTKNVPENVIVSGIPAVVIKERWNEESGRRL
jgi:serine O-acetyltransferase